jgi:hypothetical protein
MLASRHACRGTSWSLLDPCEPLIDTSQTLCEEGQTEAALTAVVEMLSSEICDADRLHYLSRLTDLCAEEHAESALRHAKLLGPVLRQYVLGPGIPAELRLTAAEILISLGAPYDLRLLAPVLRQHVLGPGIPAELRLWAAEALISLGAPYDQDDEVVARLRHLVRTGELDETEIAVVAQALSHKGRAARIDVSATTETERRRRREP